MINQILNFIEKFQLFLIFFVCFIGFFFETYQTLFVGIIAGLIAICYERQKTKIEDQTFKREIFHRYNEKYNLLNDNLVDLSKISVNAHLEFYSGGKSDLKDWIEYIEDTKNIEYTKNIFDYLNLCAEEYYWHKKGFVEKEVWGCWHSGMISWYKKAKLMQAVVHIEKSTEASYYNEDFLELFDEKVIKDSFEVRKIEDMSHCNNKLILRRNIF